MFAKKIATDPATDDISAAQAVARAVPKSAALCEAEVKRNKARAERDDLRERLKQLTGHIGRPGEAQVIGQIKAISSGLKMAERFADIAHGEYREAREPYARAVEAALQPLRAGAAQRVLQAVDDLTEAVALLDEIALEARRAGGEVADMPPLLLAETIARARAWA